MGAGGVIRATPEFLARVRDAAHAAGALLVLDEVITFRLATGGTQSLVGVEPDLTMLGKLIGGGFPVGGVGGKRKYLEIFDPENPRGMHSGTYNGNPVTMTAGLVSVRELTAERIRVMEELGERLAASLARSAGQHGLPLALNRCGSLLQLYFSGRDRGRRPGPHVRPPPSRPQPRPDVRLPRHDLPIDGDGRIAYRRGGATGGCGNGGCCSGGWLTWGGIKTGGDKPRPCGARLESIGAFERSPPRPHRNPGTELPPVTPPLRGSREKRPRFSRRGGWSSSSADLPSPPSESEDAFDSPARGE